MTRLALHWQILIGMTLGAVIGLLANSFLSESTTLLDPDQLPPGVSSAVVVTNNDGTIVSYATTEGTEITRRMNQGSFEKDVFSSFEKMRVVDPIAANLGEQTPETVSSQIAGVAHFLGGLFLRMLKMVSVPLIIASLASGMMGLGAGRSFGRMFRWTISYYLTTSLIAITLGLLMVNLFAPGINSGISFDPESVTAEPKSLLNVLTEQMHALIPDNPLGSVTEPNFLSIIAFTILFSVFTLQVGDPVLSRIRQLVDDLMTIMLRLTIAIISLAPIGVFFLMLDVTAAQGTGVFQALGKYMLTVFVALSVHAFVVLPLILYFFTGRNPIQFFSSMSPALLTAFSSASSNGTLPLTMTCVEGNAGVSKRSSSFVLPLGATINMDGTALYEAVAVLFIAQIVNGDLSIAQQITVAITALLASVGAAGIPHAGLVMMTIILQAVNLPIEMQGIILAVDRLLDMMRTSVNVWSDSCAAAVIDRVSADNPLSPSAQPALAQTAPSESPSPNN
jgi:Na+/H+-dicarboxylate symporter